MTSLALTFKPFPVEQPFAWLRVHRREVGGSVLMAAAVLGGFGVIAGPAESIPRPPTPEERVLAATPPPKVEPLVVQAIAPTRAMQINAAVPIDTGPNPPARPFTAPPVKSVAYARALECLTQAIYYEAAREPTEGQRAVAQVVLNRVRHPVYPASVCGVVYQGSERDTGCQFTFTCDGSLARGPDAFHWARARKVAEAALKGEVYKPVGYATHYHANYVVPYWAPTLAKNAVIGAHIFYRWSGGWGRPPAFTQRYAAAEPNTAVLRSAALAAEAQQQIAQPDVEELLEEIPGAEAGKPAEGRVAIRFNLAAARKAVEEVQHTPYVEKMAASDNLRWSLSGGIVAEQEKEKPLGKTEPVIGETAPSGAGDE